MTWAEKLKAKLKEKGLPEYLSGIFKGSNDDDISRIIDGFGEVKADDSEFETTLSSLVQKNIDGIIDSRVNRAVVTHENKLRDKFNFTDKKAGETTTKNDPEPAGELAELKKLISGLSAQVTAITEQGSKNQLVGSFLQRAKEEKKLPENWAKKYTHLIGKGEDVEPILDAAEKEYTEMTQLIINDQFGGTKPPVKGEIGTSDSSIKDYVQRKNEGKTAGVIRAKEL
jgi:hypothetical protein